MIFPTNQHDFSHKPTWFFSQTDMIFLKKKKFHWESNLQYDHLCLASLLYPLSHHICIIGWRNKGFWRPNICFVDWRNPQYCRNVDESGFRDRLNIFHWSIRGFFSYSIADFSKSTKHMYIGPPQDTILGFDSILFYIIRIKLGEEN